MTGAPALWQNPRARAVAAAELEIRRRRREREATQAAVTFPEWYARTVPAQWGEPPRHVRYLLSLVQDVVEGRTQRLCISTPPGHGKTDTVTRRLPVYWAERHPDDAVVFTGYSQRFAEKNLSQQAREIAAELGVLAADATALDEWRLTNGARLVTRGVGNPPTGVNPISLLVADDPIKSRADAASLTLRDNVWQWWTGSIVQRFWPRTRAVVIATRWHEDDLIGRLRKADDPANGGPGEWTFVNLPALALDDDPLGREPGEALWPAAKPAPFLHALRRSMGPYEFEAVFQGNPTPREGSLFRVGKFGYVDAAEVPRLVSVCRAWDLAATAGAGDYTAGVKVGRSADGRFFVLDVVRGQWDSAQRNARMRQTAEADGKAVKVHLPQDPGQAGKDQAQSLTRMLAGFVVRAEPVSGSKEVRADPYAAQVNAGAANETGNVSLVRAPWNDAFVEEHRAFPAGANDDQVDAGSDAFTEVAVEVVSIQRPGSVRSNY
ncbi:MAG TPA: phage terminase large subunit [Rubricoccaceae bacterium]